MQKKNFVYIYFVLFVGILPLGGQAVETGPVIKKCTCRGNEAESSTGCIANSSLELLVPVWYEASNTVKTIPFSSLPFIVQPLECPTNSVNEVLYDFPFFSTDGELIHNQIYYDQYCIENVVNNAGIVSQRTEKCVEKPPIQLCCDITEYMDSSYRCTKIPAGPVKIKTADWLNKFNYSVKSFQCTDAELTHRIVPQDMPLSVLNDMFFNYYHSSDGNFCLGMYGDENELYPAITYCDTNGTALTELQFPNIRYCCEQGKAFNLSIGQCVDHSEGYKFPENFQWPAKGASEGLSIMKCSHFAPFEIKNDTKHYFLPNGSVHTDSGNIIHETDYCLGIVISDRIQHSGLACLKEEIHHCSWRWEVYRVCLGISSVFLAITLIVYVGVAELRRRIGGVCLISQLLALLVSQITLIVIQTKQRDFSAPGCLVAGVVEIVFVLASFFWLNIMCYDVWSTFRVLRPFSEKVFHAKLFIKYSLYGWGVPLLVGAVAVALQLTDSKLTPNFTPETKCFFHSNDLDLQWFYLYGIILILLLINLFFFVHLAITMIKSHMENRKHLKKKNADNTSDFEQNIENLRLHGKLFIVMGLPWIIEALTSFASSEIECYIWFLDLINMLRGVLIFIIFVCKKSTRDKLIAAWCPSYKPQQLSSQVSRKTTASTLSLTSWLPSIKGRKISKVSMTSGGHINLEALKEEADEVMKEVILRIQQEEEPNDDKEKKDQSTK